MPGFPEGHEFYQFVFLENASPAGNTKVQLFSKVRKLCELFLPFI